MIGDRLRSRLVNELEARVHSGKVLEGQRDELEAAGVVAPGKIVVDEPAGVGTPPPLHPTHHASVELPYENAGEKNKNRGPKPQQPPLPAPRGKVRVGGARPR